MLASSGMMAQEAPKDTTKNVIVQSDGNFIAVTKKKEPTKTNKTYTDSKGVIYPVWESVNGKLFIKKVSKNGNEYNYYLKL